MEFEQLIRLIETVSESELTELKYEENGMKLALSKKQRKAPAVELVQAAPSGTAKVPTEAEKVQAVPETEDQGEEPEGRYIQSPLVGTFYTAPSEDAPAFVSVGDRVVKGQVLAIVEAMKLMNEIESEYDGTVAEILVQNEQAVEYGQKLFRIV